MSLLQSSWDGTLLLLVITSSEEAAVEVDLFYGSVSMIIIFCVVFHQSSFDKQTKHIECLPQIKMLKINQ